MIPRVSVVIPTYNQAAWLRQALQSVLDQTVTEWEAIVVNNHSDDDTVAVVEGFADPRITLVNYRNHGIIGASRNQGIERARASWVAFLDSDDRWHPRKLELCLEVAERDPEAAVIAHAMNMVQGDRVEWQLFPGPDGRGNWRSLLFDGTCATPSASLVGTRWLRRVGGVSEDPRYRTAEDYECWMKIAEAGGRFVFMPQVLTDYRIHATSASSSVDLHLAASLAVVGDHFARIGRPGLAERLLYRRRLATLYRGAGRKRVAAGAARDAQRFFLRSLACMPTPRTLAAMVLGLGAGVIGAIRKSAAETRFRKVRSEVDTVTGDAQERNRMWWERLPMTYASWEAEKRTPETADDYREMEGILLRHSTFLRERFDFAALKGCKVLDIGCGAGVLACLLAKNGAEVTAIDLTETGVALTRRNAEAQGLAINVRQMDAERMTLPEASMDFIWSWGVLHHSQSTERALVQAARALRPGGKGLMMVYHRSSAVYYLKGLWWLLAKGKVLEGHTLSSVLQFYIDGYYHRHFTAPELAEALRSAGLVPKRLFACQQEQPLLPIPMPHAWDEALKTRFGWYLVAEFERPA